MTEDVLGGRSPYSLCSATPSNMKQNSGQMSQTVNDQCLAMQAIKNSAKDWTLH